MIKDVSETIKNETNKQKGGFLGILLGTLGAGLVRSMSADKGEIATKTSKGTIRPEEGTIRADQDF